MRVPLVTIKIAEFIFAPLVLDSRRVVFTRSVDVKGVLEGVDMTRRKRVNQPVGQGVVLRSGVPERGRLSSWSVRALECQSMFWSGPSGRRGLL